MLKIKTTTRFEKDLKRIKKRGYNLLLLNRVIKDLAAENKLDSKYHDHALVGNLKGFRECHISPDWLLIYSVDKNHLILVLSRTGSHSDLLNM